MAINYTQAFNAGELSRNIDGRSDFEVYKVGCRSLKNFLVLPQGGVERRSGTEFVRLTGTDGSTPARLIKFDFSSDNKYVIELGTNYAKVHYTDANGADQVINVTGTINYTEAELETIQHNRRYDTLVLTCPTKETMILARTQISPLTFTISNISYSYPPLMEGNLTSTNIDVGTRTSGDQYTGVVPLVASGALFDSGHVGSTWAIDHIRATDKKDIAWSVDSGSSKVYSPVLDASFSNWSFETTGSWKGAVELEKNVAGTGWYTYLPIGDTSTGDERNFADSSTEREGANTEIRIAFTRHSGSGFSITLKTDNSYHKGLVKITAVANSTNATATILSQIQGGQADPGATVYWSEGAFSNYRGFSPASEFFENRLWLAGSKDEPADLFASQFGDIYNFLNGTLSTDSIKRTIDSPEEPKWLEGKRYLFLGTSETAVSIRSADEDSLMTQSNITTLVENAYGSDSKQAEIAGDVILYIQRDGLKLRELVYNNSADTFMGNDLNVISEDINESGIKEMFIQKTPNQFVWCVKNNGDACIMTYDRGQNIRGWARLETDGEFISATSINDDSEDAIWVCVNRGLSPEVDVNGNFSNGAEGWSAQSFGTGETVESVLSTGSARIVSSDGGGQSIRNYGKLVVDHEYEMTYTISSQVTGNIGLGSDLKQSTLPSTVGTHTFKFTSRSANLTIKRDGYSSAPCDVTISNIVLRDLSLEPGNKYCIEKFHPRKDLNWYVDSGKEFTGTGLKSGTSKNDISDDYLKINITNHGYSTGDFVNIESSIYEDLEGNNFEVERVDDNNFFLRIIGTTNKVPVKEFTVTGTARVDGTYILDRGFGDLNDLQTRYTHVGSPSTGYSFQGFTPSQRYISNRWLITTPNHPEASDDFAGVGVDFAWDVSWGSGSELAGGTFGDGEDKPIVVKQINNKVTGLEHLNSKTVQVLVDDNYIEDKVVSNGEVIASEYGTKVTAGLPYISTLQPMPIEPAFNNINSQSRVKAASKVIVRFF